MEDHPVMRGTLVEFLEVAGGMEVCGTAESVEEALEEIPSANPTLILLDLSLPDGDGYTLVREIQERWSLPCIVLTGQGGREAVDRAFESGAAGFLRKGRPWEIPEALRRVAGGERYLSELPDPELGAQDQEPFDPGR